MRLIISFIVFIVCAASFSFAQTPSNKADSLIAQLANAKEDTNKYNLLQALSNIYYQENPVLGLKYGKEALELATKLNYELGQMRGNNLMARCYAVQNNLPEALKHFQAGLLIAQKLKNYRFEGVFLSSISAVYATNSDYNKALDYAMQAKTVNEKADIKYMVNLMTNIGYLYIRQDKFDEALKYYEEGLRQELTYGSKETIGELANLYLNLGGVYIRMSDFVPAMQNYSKADSILQQIGHTKNHIFAIADLGECYLRIAKGMSKKPLPDSLKNKNANLDKAQRYLEEAFSLGNELALIDVRTEVSASLADLYAMQGKYEKAYEMKNRHIVFKDSMRDISKEKELAKVEAEFHVRKQTDSLNYLNAIKDKEITRRKLERNGSIALLSMAGIIGLLIINRQKLKHQQKRKIAESEAIRIAELASLQLDDFTRSIHEKNELIEQFTAEIERYQALPCSNELPNNEHSLQLLQNSVILTEEQWIDFQSLFDKVHTGYINRVKGKYPDLTAAELRFIVLTRLSLTNREMASMLGVSMEAVRVSKHRLLKKIQLPDGVTLEDTVLSI